MIRKFATVLGFRVGLGAFCITILAGAATVHAQQTPAQQTPAQQPPAQPPAAQQTPENPQSSSQEASPEEASPRHKNKPKNYTKWSFNVGGGASLTSGTTAKYARGGGGIAAAGAARNYNPFFGLRADVQFDNLPLRTTALQLAQAPGATSHVYSVMLGPIINVPVTKVWSGYIVVGPAFLHRSGKLDSSTALPGSACNAFFTWWGPCFAGNLPAKFLSTSQNEFGLDLGGGIARKITPRIELYGEARILHGSRNGRTTDLRPITIGLRW